MGHVINENGISTDPEKLKKFQEWHRPRTVNEVRSFLGYTTYYRKFIFKFTHISNPLNKLLQKNIILKWSAECEEAFTAIIKAFCEVVTLVYINFSKQYIVDTGACDF